MERLGGGPHQRGPMTTLAAASIHSTTLRDSFLASDIADRNHRSHSDIARTSSFAGLTLEAVLNIDRSRSSPTNHGDAATSSSSGNTENNSAIVRTLLDILQNEQALIPSSTNLPGKKTWKSLKDRLKLRRLPVIAGPFSSSNPVFSWTASQPVSRSSLEVQGQGQMMSDQDSIQDVPRSSEIRQTGSSGNDTVPAGDRLTIDSSGRAESGGGGSMRLAAALAAEREETRRRLPMQLGVAGTDGEMNEGRGHTGSDQRCSSVNEREGNPSGSGGGGEPVRMSLMDLLEETDGHGGIQDQTYLFDPVDVEEDEEAEQRAGGKGGVGEVPCCVCLVRHKGAAFIPCGHTFCRLCSRELWVQRGHCPLCNNFIVEILDIF